MKRAPELYYALRGYTRKQALGDVTAGVIVGIVALPLAIAFAIASGLPPEYGIYTAIIAGFLISALGGSRVQIGGPTGAFVVIVYGIVQVHGIAGLTIATVMAGLMLIIMGVVRLGAAIKFIPFPVTTGFTSGIAVVIASSQVRDLLGLTMADVPAEFVEKWAAYAESLHTIHLPTVGIAALALSAVDIALWDLKAKLLNTALFKLLGAFRHQVSVYASGGFCNYPDSRLVKQISEWLELGMAQVKVKISRRPEEDAHRLTTCRAQLGDEAVLMVDSNGALTRQAALHWRAPQRPYGTDPLPIR